MRFDSLSIEKNKLIEIRKELYGSNKPGFYILKNFISDQFVKHMRSFWNMEAYKSRTHIHLPESFNKADLFYYNCPNYFYKTPYGHAYYNYFWNNPTDETTHSVSFAVNYARNIIESNNNYEFFYPVNGNCCSYRIVTTMNGSPVKPHTDWTEGEYFVPRRLQATLFLSKKGIDYTGEGMKMMSNDKKTRYIFDSDEVNLNPGDLILWRYNNEHSVENINTLNDQDGFMRIIYPPEIIGEKPRDLILADFTARELANRLFQKIKNKF
ncbi:MAG TPA: hypothetical protein VNY73_07460 [Bacteroidia bacterium]|jgi:hypothetical protein|nr:hypothetical protein [Bacteroidia bacterium]